MQQANKEAFFQSRIERFQKEQNEKKQTSILVGWVRILSFLVFAAVVYALFSSRETAWAIGVIITYIPIFGILVNVHSRIKAEIQQLSFLVEINQNEILRLHRNIKSLHNGAEYLDTHHPYAPDLDIFGSHSLYQLISRNRFLGSQQILAQWMAAPADIDTITQRQAAIKELREATDWTQTHTAHSHAQINQKNKARPVSSYLQDIATDTQVLNGSIWKIAQYALPTLSIAFLVLINFMDWDSRWLFLVLGVNFLFLRLLFIPLLNLTKSLGDFSKIIGAYEEVIRSIESQTFTAPLLQSLKAKMSDGHKASTQIKQLKGSLQFLTNRGNLFYQSLNGLFMLDLFVLRRIQTWHQRHCNHVEHWFDSVDQIAALSDLAAFSFAEENYCFPTPKQQTCHVQAQSMLHPLIGGYEAITNDFTLSGRGELALITGSNMSGKSTFLRTIGINLVLAQMGAPVAAKSFSFSPLKIFTSMRTQDNLEESVSSFYAEISRIKQMLEQIDEDIPTFYLLDEILKGTNTKDRHAGATALIEQLTTSNSLGLISTHDVELAELAIDRMTNYSFNSQLSDDEISFDYKLTDGPCRSFNASALMRKMGIIKK